MRRLVGILASRLEGAVSAAEGPNEYDLSSDPRWRARLDRYQRRSRVTDLRRWLDYGNVHSYPDAEPPEWILPTWLAAARTSGAKPVMATETGNHNALAATTGQRPASEAAAVTYMPRIYPDYYARDIARNRPRRPVGIGPLASQLP